MPHSVRKLLLDIVISCEEILEFHEGIDFDQYQEDRKLQLATERQFEIIGEALTRLDRIDSSSLKANIPDYKSIIGFRNVIAHGYDVVDHAVLWDFAINKVPELMERARNYK